MRAVQYDLPMMLAIIGGDPRRFLPYVDLYKRAAKQMERPIRPLGVHSPGHIAATDAMAQEQLWPHYRKMHDRIGGERGWPPTTKESFLNEVARGSLYCGRPRRWRARSRRRFRRWSGRFDLKYSNGAMPHGQMMESIRLYGTQVIPRVREILAAKAA